MAVATEAGEPSNDEGLPYRSQALCIDKPDVKAQGRANWSAVFIPLSEGQSYCLQYRQPSQ